MKSTGFFFLLFFFTFTIWAQEPVDSLADGWDDDEVLETPDVNPENKTGIILGTGISSFISAEKNNPGPSLHLSGGMYHRYRYKPHWAVQPAFQVSLNGSSFDNDTGAIGSIKAYYLEVPLLFLYGINELNTTNIIGGLQYSRLMSAVLYKTNAVIPEDVQPALNKNDLVLMGGMQYHTPFVGFQFLLKFGLLNANKGLIPGIPPVNLGKSMNQFTFAFSLIF